MICISNIRLHEDEVPRFMDFDLFEFFTIIKNREICWWPIFESRAINLFRFNVLVVLFYDYVLKDCILCNFVCCVS